MAISLMGIPIRSNVDGAVDLDIEPEDFRPFTLAEMKRARGWAIHPRALATLCGTTEDEARAWLMENAELVEVGGGHCWMIR